MPNNMGIVRYLMAFSVLVAHFNLLEHTEIWWPISSYNAVGGFFAISGFLMAGSYLRQQNWKRYLLNRCRRILPPYWTTVIFFALILYFFSSSPDYFTSTHFWKYLISNLCFLNFIEPDLPGVFQGLEMSAVNGSLWTMKVEWMLYFTMPIATWVLVRCRKRPVIVISLIYTFSAIYRLLFVWLYNTMGSQIYETLSRQFMGQLMFFYSGVMVYYYFDMFMRWRWWILAACLLMITTLHQYQLFVIVLEPAVISFLALWLSMVGKWGTWEGKKDNISYNIYLLHFPICQLAALYQLGNRWGTWASFGAVCAVTVLLSWLMNVGIEKPLKKLF